jgi:hypothetical protein
MLAEQKGVVSVCALRCCDPAVRSSRRRFAAPGQHEHVRDHQRARMYAARSLAAGGAHCHGGLAAMRCDADGHGLTETLRSAVMAAPIRGAGLPGRHPRFAAGARRGERDFGYWPCGRHRRRGARRSSRRTSRDRRPPAVLGAARARRLVASLAVVGAVERRPARAQGRQHRGRIAQADRGARGIRRRTAARARQ